MIIECVGLSCLHRVFIFSIPPEVEFLRETINPDLVIHS